jgi:ubiquitin C-terminal hydrolase
VARQFAGYGQEDAQEFLRCLLDGMHNELNRVRRKPKYKQIDCEKEPKMSQSEVWFRHFRESDDSIISDLFEGQLCSRIVCQKCGYESLTFDTFMDLSVQIPSKSFGSVAVEDCLYEFIDSERMEKCGYKCQNKKCGAVDRMCKDITVFRFPKVLVIHLKRFSRNSKISSSVKIPSKLDMTPFAPHSGKCAHYYVQTTPARGKPTFTSCSA